MAKLCVNIDHVATIREARGGAEPDPLEAALVVQEAGAEGVTVHLREDRRHINDDDVRKIKKALRIKFNLEMSLNPGIVKRALEVVPDEATIVPEKRRELTTEGGLDVLKNMKKLLPVIRKLKERGVIVSLFIDAKEAQIRAAVRSGADFIELHTGPYAGAKTAAAVTGEFKKLKSAASLAKKLGLGVNAGHGLNYTNTKRIAGIEEITDLNTGHSIVSRAVFCGLQTAVKDMIKLARGKKV